MSSEKRLMLFIVMSGAILFGYNILLPPKKPATQAYQQAAASTPVAAESASIKTAAPIKEKPTSIKSAPEKTYEMENSLVKITFSSTGAVMNSYKLKKFSDAATGKEQTMLELIPSSSSYSYMGLDSVGLGLNSSGWTSSGVTERDGKSYISFKSPDIKGVSITKEFLLSADSYLVDINIIFKNNSPKAAAIRDMQLIWGPNIHLLPQEFEKSHDSFNRYQKIDYPSSDGKLKAHNINLKAKENKLIILPEIPSWLVIKDLHFMSSFIFTDRSKIKNAFFRENTGGFSYIGTSINDILLEPGATETVKLSSYIGPQEYKRLKKFNMQSIVDLGWIRILGIGMFYAMDFLYGLTKNYGIAILLLTLFVRLLLWYPSQKSYKQMKETQSKMKLMQPRLETLKKIYKDDPAKLNEETMKLYREYNVNPLGGCLPMLLQIPIFIALYQTLISMVELKGAYFFGWLKDLSRPDPLFILPVFMGVSMIIQQMMSKPVSMTPEAETQQKIMMWGMPIFLTFMALKWPAGLLLYWSMSNVLAIIQQTFVNKSK